MFKPLVQKRDVYNVPSPQYQDSHFSTLARTCLSAGWFQLYLAAYQILHLSRKCRKSRIENLRSDIVRKRIRTDNITKRSGRFIERCFLKSRQNFHNCICPYLLVVDNQRDLDNPYWLFLITIRIKYIAVKWKRKTYKIIKHVKFAGRAK